MGKEFNIFYILPVVIADIDYRLTYPNFQLDNRFNRVPIGNIVLYKKSGEGKPFILLIQS
jgi:hypothetical protein